ncbi:hypothetical protein GGX14DRAFT_371973 [Mycena pura]|uniref:Integrase catalytic domain-containing protein n=1 Tax=Mycena pura TaxID=153505 RepID=A0AAD6Y5T2_9AGAR|nr:hypothetical protein GGX14DRAFT_371973 [Mycena pura]
MSRDSSFNRNPKGKNQYTEGQSNYHPTFPKFCSPNYLDPEREATITAALTEYYKRTKVGTYDQIAELLEADHGILVSGKTVQRRLKKLGLRGGLINMKTLSKEAVQQLVVTEMDKDVAKRYGVNTIRSKIARNATVIIPRSVVSDVMHMHDSAAFEGREPTAKKIFRVAKHKIGIHQSWSGDGHDKLYKIGFPVYAYVEDGSSVVLNAWICPSNRLKNTVAYLWLCLVEEHEGMPTQTITDCGSETTELFAVATTLRNCYHPEFDPTNELPAHQYLRSVHNIEVERSWYRLRLDFGDNAVLKFQEGIIEGWYQPHDPDHYELCQFLWSRVLQADLTKSVIFRNGTRTRKQADKPGPSGMSRAEAYSTYKKWGGRNDKLAIPVDVVRQMKEDLGGSALMEFTGPEFTARAQAVLHTLQPVELTMDNGWKIFQIMLPLVFPERNFPVVQL